MLFLGEGCSPLEGGHAEGPRITTDESGHRKPTQGIEHFAMIHDSFGTHT